MALFRTEVLLAPYNIEDGLDTLTLLESIILDMIKMERKGEVVDRALVRGCCYMLEGLYETYTEDENSKLYLTSFEPKFLDASRKYYREEGQTLLANADASTFCSHARKRLKEEEQRCQQTISSITEPKIKAVVDKEFISAHIKDVINMEETGVKSMLDNDRVEDLKNVFQLVARVDPKKAALKDAVQKRVVELGIEINKVAFATASTAPSKASAKPPAEKGPPEKAISQQTQAAITWVEQILDLKSKYDRLWTMAFMKDPVMEKALEISFQDFINANDRSSEHVSLFLDEYLKRGGKGKSEAEVDQLLDKGILLLQYLANTDLFETYYRKHLAKRLLMKKSVSRDMERQMLSKMKMKLGNNITRNLEGMIRDTELSDSLAPQYKKYLDELGDADPTRVDIDARVVTANVWPFDALFKSGEDKDVQRQCKYPPSVERTKQLYERFYLSKHTGRKLTWMPNLGDADVRATFKSADGKVRRYELNVPTHAMIVLMLFNELPAAQPITFEEVEAETNIPRSDLVKTLSSLTQIPKWRVLRKQPAGKEILADDKFLYNETFSSQFVKIKIGAVVASNKLETSAEREETHARVDNERGHAIEAAIVRIMKQRKNLSHQQLMTETLQQLSQRFQPDINMVKKKIEALIDREYLERGPDPAKASYTYLA
jgi:cullin 3